MARRLFLERRTYRRNRLQDAARLLPVLGMILFLGPVFIIGGEGEGAGLAGWLVYLFVTWLGLIGITFLVGRALAGEDPAASLPASVEDQGDSPPAPGRGPDA